MQLLRRGTRDGVASPSEVEQNAEPRATHPNFGPQHGSSERSPELLHHHRHTVAHQDRRGIRQVVESHGAASCRSETTLPAFRLKRAQNRFR